MADLAVKLRETRIKKNDAQQALEKIQKNPQAFSPNQIDNLLTNLEEIKDKCDGIEDKMVGAETNLEAKISDMDTFIKNSEDRLVL